MKKNDLGKIKKIDWFLYLKRPLDIFSFVSNAKAYEKIKYTGKIKNLGYLYEKGFTQYFRSEKEFSENLKILGKNIKNNSSKIIKELLKGFEHNEKTKKLINEFRIDKLNDENIIIFINFYIDLFTYGTVFPYLVGLSLEKEKIRNKEIFTLVKKLRLVSYYPNFRKEVLDKIFTKLSKEKGVDIADYTPEEIICFLKKGGDRKKKRDFFYYFKIDEDVIKGSNKKIFKSIQEMALDNIDNIQDRIKGNIAHKGVVKGFAKIIYSEKDFKKFKKGNILVTINSNPSLMPIIKKCGAIIADEGGMTCHAAIVSRELGIPCVVGTKIATKVLKDGDKVEVDANKGIIKIINK